MYQDIQTNERDNLILEGSDSLLSHVECVMGMPIGSSTGESYCPWMLKIDIFLVMDVMRNEKGWGWSLKRQ